MIRYKLTDKELNTLLKNLVILTDSRERKNEHILNYFDANKIKYKKIKNDFGDYSCMIPAGLVKGIDRDIYFDKIISIERKASIDELASNLKAEERPRLKAEFAHMNKYNIECHLFIEDLLFKKHMQNETYRSLWKGKTLDATIHGLRAEYGISFQAVSKEYIGDEIYKTLYYKVRDVLLRKFDIEIS